MDGILLIDKPMDYTSRDIVNIVGKELGIKKVGHTGTLDPMATGVLVISLGKATKLTNFLTSSYKEYIASMVFGIKTDTADITGKVIEKIKTDISKQEVEETLNKFEGSYEQTVPIYSAIKVKGKKLYEYAREGIDVELPKKTVEIKNIKLLDYKKENDQISIKFQVLVSKGTYIRSLVEDIAAKLNTVGTMTNLRRIKQGKYNIEDCYTLEDIKNKQFNIMKIEEVLKDIYSVEVDDKLYKKIINGAILDNIYDEELIIFKKNDKILAAYEKYNKDKNKIKPYIMF